MTPEIEDALRDYQSLIDKQDLLLLQDPEPQDILAIEKQRYEMEQRLESLVSIQKDMAEIAAAMPSGTKLTIRVEKV